MRMLKALVSVCGTSALMLLLSASAARASTFTFTLNCTIVDATTCTPGGNFGTIELTDNGNVVDFKITLLTLNVDAIALNWDTTQGGALPIDTRWSTPALPGVNITSGTDNQGPTMRFDIRINPDNNPTPSNPLLFSLLLDSGGTNIDAAYFNVKDDVNQTYGAVRVLNATNTGPAYGALDSLTIGTTAATVPEPATLALLGTGIIGLTMSIRRKRRA